MHFSVSARLHGALFKTGTALRYLWTADRMPANLLTPLMHSLRKIPSVRAKGSLLYNCK